MARNEPVPSETSCGKLRKTSDQMNGLPPEEPGMNIPHIPGMTDEETIVLLLEILDRQDVVAATDRLCRGYGLKPIN